MRNDDSHMSTDKLLLISHFFSTLNSRAFEFGALLFIAKLIPNSLLPVSIYAFVRSLAAILGSSFVGRAVDRGNRLQTVRFSIVGGRIAVAFSSAVLLLGFLLHDWLRYVLLAVLCVPACVEKLCSIASLVSVEKDWAVVVFRDDEDQLQAINSRLRRIDLFCKIVGPLLISSLEAWSTTGSLLALLSFNLICIPIEYSAIARVYNSEPSLQRIGAESYSQLLQSAEENEDSLANEDSEYTAHENTTLTSLARQYYSSRAFVPSFALSMLYFTVLSFSGQMVAFFLAGGLSSIQVTLLRTLSVTFEIGATWLAPIAMHRAGPIRSGLWFLSWQAFCAVAATYMMWSLTYVEPAAARLGLVAGVILSRVGLWGFDLSVQFLVQTEVEDDLRGRFSTAEAALQNVFELLAYLLTIIFAQPASFKYPVAISAVNVVLAATVYAGFVRNRRGHLLHVACCEK